MDSDANTTNGFVSDPAASFSVAPVYSECTGSAVPVGKMLSRFLQSDACQIVEVHWANDGRWTIQGLSENISRFGYRADQLTASAVSFKSLIHVDDLKKIAANIASLATASLKCCDIRIRDSRDRIRYVDVRAVANRSEAGTIVGYQALLFDVTETQKLHTRIEYLATELRYTKAFHRLDQIVNEATVLKESLSEICKILLTTLVATSTKLEFVDERKTVVSCRVRGNGPAVLREIDADEFDIESFSTAPANRTGRRISSVIVVDQRDIGIIEIRRPSDSPRFVTKDQDLLDEVAKHLSIRLQRGRQLFQVQQMAYHDPATQLPNRILFEERLGEAIAEARDTEKGVATMFIDLDGFKQINDSLGHQAGDELLLEVANRLKNSVRKHDTVARLGGDEFALVLEGVTADRAQTIAEKLLEKVRESYKIDSNEVHVGASIGISMFPEHGSSVNTLLRTADAAMYYVKENGRNAVHHFTESLSMEQAAKQKLENDLSRAIDSDQLVLEYQPQIDLNSGEIVGAEALVRWNHPIRGMLGPRDFLSIAEETRMILPISEWILVTACRLNQKIAKELGISVRMAVNISAVQFERPDFAEMVTRTLKFSGMSPDRLELEITERILMGDLNNVTVQLARLRELGVRVAIDDFGTGYSSLQYLQELPIDCLKIDGKFVQNMEENTKGHSLVKTIMQLAECCNLQTVAEGVETEEQFHLARSAGCDNGQGYLFFRPLSKIRLMELFRSTTSIDLP